MFKPLTRRTTPQMNQFIVDDLLAYTLEKHSIKPKKEEYPYECSAVIIKEQLFTESPTI